MCVLYMFNQAIVQSRDTLAMFVCIIEDFQNVNLKLFWNF